MSSLGTKEDNSPFDVAKLRSDSKMQLVSRDGWNSTMTLDMISDPVLDP